MTKILEVKNLKKYFPIQRGLLRRHVDDNKAVDEVSFAIEEGQIVGLVGESGSGKSTAARAAIRLLEPTAGEIHFDGQNLCSLSAKQLRKVRPSMQMVFQDPLASLNPRKTVLDNIGEALLYHRHVKTREEQAQRVVEILEKVKMPASALDQYPHQFSGGQQQRISIGRALALQPKLIICDEALSALDLSVQAEILNLLSDLKTTFKLSYLFISHDLSVVKGFCDTTLVMYRGIIVESGPTHELFASPKHPYTQMLLESVPKTHPKERKKRVMPHKIEAENGFTGCRFFGRCPVSEPSCSARKPPLKQAEDGHSYSCIH